MMPSPIQDASPPSLVDQSGPNGTWKAYQTSPTSGFMSWTGGPDGPFERLVDQVHDTGKWSTGPHCSMTWIPTPTDSEDNP